MKALIKNFVIVLVAMLVGAATVIGYLHSQPVPALVPQVASAASAASPALVDESTITSIYQNISPSVVSITSTTNLPTNPHGRNPFGTPFGQTPTPQTPQTPQVPQEQGTGSGLIVDAAHGYILTNNHVVQGATKLDVTLSDGTTVSGKVLGSDPGNDLAVVQITPPAGETLKAAPLGDSSKLQVGQLAVAIGNPFGLDGTLTTGVISALNRTYGTGTNGRPIQNMIQTDAPINPGNSGGPLIDSAGQVIGINSDIESPVGANVGIGFAIPINTATAELASLEAGKAIAHAWLGISGTSVTPSLASDLNIPAGGVYVVSVSPNSPAAQAGLKGASTSPSNGTAVPTGGDVILSVDGKQVNKVGDISGYLDTKQPGDVVTLNIRRNGSTQDVKVTLGTWPATTPQQ